MFLRRICPFIFRPRCTPITTETPALLPKDFLWGSATASHQVEGGNTLNDWWEWETSGRLAAPSGLACDQYRRYENDLDLAASLAHNAYRFSLEWSRIEPAPGQWSEEPLAHYEKVIQACRKRSLEPIVTLHHFTNPQWFAAQGGWASSKSVEAFARYVKVAAKRLGGAVDWWITINEPTVLAHQGYLLGEWPPGARDARKAFAALRHLIEAHKIAYQIIHEASKERLPRRPGACTERSECGPPRNDIQVGLAQHTRFYTPCRATSALDWLSTRFRHWLGNRHALDSCRGRMDFLGLNYYTRDFIRWGGVSPTGLLGIPCEAGHHNGGVLRSSMGWEIYPRGLGWMLRDLKSYGLPILITENGVSTPSDLLRWQFIRAHIEEMLKAMSQGIRVVGYLYWSLVDNFEWAHGFAPRFGLVEVDYATQERRVRPSAIKLAELIRTGVLD